MAMAENYALWLVKKGFVDKYTRYRYESGEVAVFERERAAEIVATLGKNALVEVNMPEGFCLTADGELQMAERPAEAAEQTEEAAGENPAIEKPDAKPATRRGKGNKK